MHDVTCRDWIHDVTCTRAMSPDVTCTRAMGPDVTCTRAMGPDVTCTRAMGPGQSSPTNRVRSIESDQSSPLTNRSPDQLGACGSSRSDTQGLTAVLHMCLMQPVLHMCLMQPVLHMCLMQPHSMFMLHMCPMQPHSMLATPNLRHRARAREPWALM